MYRAAIVSALAVVRDPKEAHALPEPLLRDARDCLLWREPQRALKRGAELQRVVIQARPAERVLLIRRDALPDERRARLSRAEMLPWLVKIERAREPRKGLDVLQQTRRGEHGRQRRGGRRENGESHEEREERTELLHCEEQQNGENGERACRRERREERASSSSGSQ
jgi:hypothetical protein